MLHIGKIFVRWGGKLLHCEIYQQDILLSENKVSLSMRVEGPYLSPRKTIVSTFSNDVRGCRICNSVQIKGKSWCVVLPLKWGSFHHKGKARYC